MPPQLLDQALVKADDERSRVTKRALVWSDCLGASDVGIDGAERGDGPFHRGDFRPVSQLSVRPVPQGFEGKLLRIQTPVAFLPLPSKSDVGADPLGLLT